MNRSARRSVLFQADGDYRTFLDCLARARGRHRVALFAYCVMPNHFHLVCRPPGDGVLANFMHALTLSHGKRWHRNRGSGGQGAVYQGRYKASVIKSDRHFHTVCRYVERNPLRAGLVDRAEEWRWSSLSGIHYSHPAELDPWPLPKPTGWLRLVNGSDVQDDVDGLRKLLRGQQPFGDPEWQASTTERLDALRAEGGRRR
jgi:putative transposase